MLHITGIAGGEILDSSTPKSGFSPMSSFSLRIRCCHSQRRPCVTFQESLKGKKKSHRLSFTFREKDTVTKPQDSPKKSPGESEQKC